MEKLSELKIMEYKYGSKEEREQHVKWMEHQGFECSEQVKKSDGSLFEENRKFYWYGKFK
ncbi:hypothetical protein [Heyndrickxia ginsengihumi]|uniref:hypothetical protein n=1 Tax=Heyndrickxia ginsengihumi TaxID=363870 RepID=UPI000471A448|nr:hypothetical protein [Heyndrickxia ginsengihumi]